MRLSVTVLIMLLLSGCWYGDGLFVASDARAVLAPGVYRLVEPDKAPRDVSVSVLPSGITQIDDPDGDGGDLRVGLVPLSESRVLLWFSKDADAPDDQTQLYALGLKRGDGFAFLFPACTGADARVAKAAGAIVEQSTTDSCRFTSKGAVLRAMSTVQPSEKDTIQLTKIR